MINIAVLGTGKIIPEAIEAIQASKKFNVAVIWARSHSADKAQNLAEKFHINRISTDLNEILNDAMIDFAYIGLVNSVHYEYTKRALMAADSLAFTAALKYVDSSDSWMDAILLARELGTDEVGQSYAFH